jgi:hypothetical protein
MFTATTWPLSVPPAHAAPPRPAAGPALRLRLRRPSVPHRGAPVRMTVGCADTWRVRVRRPAGRRRTAPHRARVAASRARVAVGRVGVAR